MEYTKLLWDLLDAGELEAVQKLDPELVDWSALHPVHNITWVVQCVQKCIEYEEYEDSEDYESGKELEALKWFIKSGASVTQKCPEDSEKYFAIKMSDSDEKVLYRGHSAVSYVLAWRVQLKPTSTRLGGRNCGST